jgi:uncharacterized membrane protein YqhA
MNGIVEDEPHVAETQSGASGRRGPLKRLLEGSRYLVVIGVIASLVASAAAFIWGAYKTAALLVAIVQSGGKEAVATTGLTALMDKFLIAAGLYIFAVGMYELFVDDLDLPSWLVVHSMQDLKGQLVSIVILLLGIVFLEHVIEWRDGQMILQMGIGIAAVIAALIAFNVFVGKH